MEAQYFYGTFYGIAPILLSRYRKERKPVALVWLKATAHKRIPATTARIERRLPMASIKPPTMRAMLDKVTARGVTDTAQRIGKTCELVFAYAIGRGLVERDATVGMHATMPQAKKVVVKFEMSNFN